MNDIAGWGREEGGEGRGAGARAGALVDEREGCSGFTEERMFAVWRFGGVVREILWRS